MPIPDYQTIKLPLLKSISDGEEHTFGELVETLAAHFRLSPNERAELLPSGVQRTFENRVGWAGTYLSKAGLIERPSRGRYRITAQGQKTLGEGLTRIDNKYLMQFPSFRAFKKIDKEHDGNGGNGPEKTPEETLREAYRTLRATLESDLLERVTRSSPKFFENLVLDVLFAMGYGGSRRDALRAVGKSGDEGIDGVIDQDRLGLEKIYVQAKRWTGTVGRPVVQAFAGSLEGAKARKGVLISTSEFSQEAEKYAQGIEKRIILINGEKLAELMIDYGVGVTAGETLSLKKIDMDYFGEQA